MGVWNMATEPNATPAELEAERELAAIARMIAFTRQSAHAQGLDLVTYCLDMALAAAMEELEPPVEEEAGAVQSDVGALGEELLH